MNRVITFKHPFHCFNLQTNSASYNTQSGLSFSSFFSRARIWGNSRKSSRSSDHPGDTSNPPPWPSVQSNLGHELVMLRDSCAPAWRNMGLRAVGLFLEILDKTHFISSLLCSLVSLLACFLALFSVFHPCQHAVSGAIVPLETHPCSKLGLQSPVGFLCILFKHVFWVGHFN